jgi:hypothetical protein
MENYCHKDPLLGNDREANNETTAIARKQLRKYSQYWSIGPHATMDVLLKVVFSMGPFQGCVTRPAE